jgi:hypothetical protein
MLLAERFWTGSGYIQIALTALYGAYIAHQMKDPKKTAIWRLRVWKIFTIVFFPSVTIRINRF